MGCILYLVVLGFGSVILAQLDKNQSDEACSDKAPKNAPFSCYRYARVRLCNGIENEFCRKSCERCSCTEEGAQYCDVQGLTAFKNSFWKGQEYLKSWRGDNPCEWNFIHCDPTNNRVIHILFNNIPLIQTITQGTMSGSLVPELSKLRYLEMLIVRSVFLNGELPLEYSVLNKLVQFDLSHTRGVIGTLPIQFSLWSQIQIVVFQNNRVSGTIPVEFSLWTSIELLNLNENSLYGKIPPNFSVWKQLDFIFLMYNKFTGTLSKEFSKWNQVQVINVLDNKLSGSLPKEYSTLSRMMQFIVNTNHLRGKLPAEYSKWAGCNIFAVSWNFLSGTLPIEYSKMKRIEGFYINSNKFRGLLPKEYSTMIRLEEFRAFDTYLVNHVPKEWSKLQTHIKFTLPNNIIRMQQKHLNPQKNLSP